MNTTKRIATVAHPLNAFGAFVFHAFSTKAAETSAPAQGVFRTARRETATAAQAARLSQALGYEWSSNLRSSVSRSKVAV